MMAGRFERYKCSFGMMGEELETLRLDLPASVTKSDFPEQGIWNRQLLISRCVYVSTGLEFHCIQKSNETLAEPRSKQSSTRRSQT